MDLSIISIAAVETVGFIQIIKNFLPEKTPTWIYSIIMLVLAVAFSFISTYAPKVITTALLTVCVSQIGYETILQTIKKIAAKIGE